MSGKEESTSFHVLSLGPCSAIAVQSWRGVKFILFADVELEKAIPSLPTMISIMSVTPLEAQSFFSLLLMAREALVKSGCPVPNRHRKASFHCPFRWTQLPVSFLSSFPIFQQPLSQKDRPLKNRRSESCILPGEARAPAMRSKQPASISR